MSASATTVISQLLTEARQRWGVDTVVALEVPPALWEPGIDEVAAAGGEIGFDHFVVDGVAVRQLPAGDTPRFHLVGRDEPVNLA